MEKPWEPKCTSCQSDVEQDPQGLFRIFCPNGHAEMRLVPAYEPTAKAMDEAESAHRQ